MGFEHLVLLRPSEIYFTRNVLQPKFDNGMRLVETVSDIEHGDLLLGDIPCIEVVWYYEKSSWYTLDNRRLWVFKELEKSGECVRIKAQRVEAIENIMDFPTKLYKSARLKEENRTDSHSGKGRDGESIIISTIRTEEVKIQRNERGRSRSKSRETTTVVRDSRRGMTYEERVSVKCDYREFRHSERKDHHYEEESKRRTSKSKAPRKSFVAHNRFHPSKPKRCESPSNEKALCVRDRLALSPVAPSSGREVRVLPRHLTDAGIFFWSHFHYEVWRYKRSQFFQRALSGGHARASVRAIETLYTCGVCFKSFKAKVSLDQHSEELMHWACVRCGRFFGSFTALGQHKLRLGHVA